MQTSWGQTQELSVAESSGEVRAAFIRKTYIHLALAILAFAGIEFILLNSPLAGMFVQLIGGGKFNWLIVLAGFMGVSFLANKWANSETSQFIQYLGLGLYVTAQAVIFLPIMIMALLKTGDASLIQQAGLLTGALFCGLTAVCFVTGKNFSFLGPFLMIAGFLGLGFIVCSIIFGFNLGVGFAFIMAGIAAGSILYNTSNLIHEYNPKQHVAAALALFASVATLFFYILRIFLHRD